MSRILAVDDNPADRELLTEWLGALHSVTTAENGHEALQVLSRQPFDLVLLDVWMPGMNGLELLAAMQKRQLTPKVIIITGDDTPETLLGAVREQAYHYVTKPVDRRALLELIEGALAAPPAPPIEVLSARPDWVELRLPCDLATAERVKLFLGQLKADLPQDTREAIGLAFHEMLMNAIEWGGGLDPGRRVRVSYLRARRMILYRISDPGAGFRLEELAHAAVSNPPDQPFAHVKARQQRGLRGGGFGILLTQTKVDELLYNETRNEVVFIKYLD